MSQELFQDRVTRVFITYDKELDEVKQVTQIDLLLCDTKLKQEAFDTWQRGGHTSKLVEDFRLVAQRCVVDGIPASTRPSVR